MDSASIDRIVTRLRADPRDMVSMLQAREVIPGLRDAPVPEPEVDPFTAAMSATSPALTSGSSVVIRTSPANDQNGIFVFDNFRLDEQPSQALTQLQSRLQLRVPMPSELQIGMRVLIAHDANRLSSSKEIWLPQMNKYINRFGTIHTISRATASASPMVSVVFVDHELSRVNYWWFPIDSLRLVNVLPCDAVFGATSLVGLRQGATLASGSKVQMIQMSRNHYIGIDVWPSSIHALLDCQYDVAHALCRRAYLHLISKPQFISVRNFSLGYAVPSGVLSSIDSITLKAACGATLSVLSDVSGRLVEAICPFSSEQLTAIVSSADDVTLQVDAVVNIVHSLGLSIPDLVDSLLIDGCDHIRENTVVLSVRASGAPVCMQFADCQGIVLGIYDKNVPRAKTERSPWSRSRAVDGFLSLFSHATCGQALQYLPLTTTPIVLPLKQIWIKYSSSGGAVEPSLKKVNLLVQPVPWQLTLALHLMNNICIDVSRGKGTLDQHTVCKMMDRVFLSIQSDWMPGPLREKFISINLALLQILMDSSATTADPFWTRYIWM